jgi:hypothetical protein
MVNSKNLLTAGVLSLAVASIVSYMAANGLTTEDVTLVDACYRASQVKGINVETCDELKQHKYEWDTVIACVPAFKEELYYWTPRMMFGYFTGGKEEIAQLGRKNKGEKEIVYTAAQNLTYAEALNERCGPATEDEQYPIYQEVRKQLGEGVELEDVDLSMFEDRELWGWNQTAGWIAAALGMYLVAWVFFNSQALADAANYKACSTGLVFMFSGVIDRAECSGNHPARCRRYHSSGPSGWWSSYHRGGNNRLNNGCNVHDRCLQSIKPWPSGSGPSCWWCDEHLSRAGKKGVQWKWPGVSCGWRGCRSWWFGWSYPMSDSRFQSGIVWLGMAAHPNGGW